MFDNDSSCLEARISMQLLYGGKTNNPECHVFE